MDHPSCFSQQSCDMYNQSWFSNILAKTASMNLTCRCTGLDPRSLKSVFEVFAKIGYFPPSQAHETQFDNTGFRKSHGYDLY